jgi:hypothetical protein
VALVVAVRDGGKERVREHGNEHLFQHVARRFVFFWVSGSTSFYSGGQGIIWLGRIYGIQGKKALGRQDGSTTALTSCKAMEKRSAA